MEHTMLRALRRNKGIVTDVDRVAGEVGREASRVRAEAFDEPARTGRCAIVGQVAGEEWRPDAGIDGQPAVKELAAIFARNLMEQGDGEAVALFENVAAGCRDSGIDREDVE